MKKYFCDACGEEIDGRKYDFEILCHITESRDLIGNYYIDNKGNPTSGRLVVYDLCLACYNKIMGAAFNKFEDIKSSIID